jgi:subtilisin family serine protease
MAPALPVVSVGAQNPNGTDALFSNVGSWVVTYRQGAAIMSTMPPNFQGGFEPMARTHSPDGRLREALDPDDFSSGFGLWSGTSFSAPVAAGAVACALLGQIEPADQVADAATALDRARTALESCLAEQP